MVAGKGAAGMGSRQLEPLRRGVVVGEGLGGGGGRSLPRLPAPPLVRLVDW